MTAGRDDFVTTEFLIITQLGGSSLNLSKSTSRPEAKKDRLLIVTCIHMRKLDVIDQRASYAGGWNDDRCDTLKTLMGKRSAEGKDCIQMLLQARRGEQLESVYVLKELSMPSGMLKSAK